MKPTSSPGPSLLSKWRGGKNTQKNVEFFVTRQNALGFLEHFAALARDFFVRHFERGEGPGLLDIGTSGRGLQTSGLRLRPQQEHWNLTTN